MSGRKTSRGMPVIARGNTAFARGSNGGVIVTASPLATVHRQLIIAARHSLPAVGGFHSTCLPALATDRVMEAWYHPSIA